MLWEGGGGCGRRGEIILQVEVCLNRKGINSDIYVDIYDDIYDDIHNNSADIYGDIFSDIHNNSDDIQDDIYGGIHDIHDDITVAFNNIHDGIHMMTLRLQLRHHSK